ncbi:unnamed protein product [Urochloa humidicola]
MGDALVGALLGAVVENVAALCSNLLQKRCKLLSSFQEDIGYLKRELEMIAGEEEDELLRMEDQLSAVKSISMKKLRVLAHDIEDCLDRILRFSEGEGKSSNILNMKAVRRSLQFAVEVDQLKEQLKAEHQRKVDYKVPVGIDKPKAQREITKVPVGIDKPKQEVLNLLDHIIDDQPDQLRVISIVGFGGSGKSTLARAVFDCQDVVDRFHCRVWVVASQHGGDTKGLLTALFKKLLPKDPVKDEIEQLQNEISNYLTTKR